MRYAVLFALAAMLGMAPLAQAADAPAAVPAPAAVTPAVTPAPAQPFSEAERGAIEDIIKDYLVNKHPEVLMDAMKELQKREQASAEEKSKTAIAGAKDKIFNNPDSPVAGNPKGDVTVVEFFDYQCGYCKMSEESVEKLLKEDKNVKFIYKDFPILGPISVTASKAALASMRQGADKHEKFHDALMAKKDHLTEEALYQTAKDVGLNIEKLKKDMAEDSIGKMIEANLQLGSDIAVRGTPMFIINEQVYPGAIQYDQLKKAIADARTKK